MRIKSGSPEPQPLGEEPTKASKEAVPAETNLDALPSSLTEEIRNKNSELTKEMELPEPTNAAQTGLKDAAAIQKRAWQTNLNQAWAGMVNDGFGDPNESTYLSKQIPGLKLSFLPVLGQTRKGYVDQQKRLGMDTVFAANSGRIHLKESIGYYTENERKGEKIYSGWSLTNPLHYQLELPLSQDIDSLPTQESAEEALQAFVLQELDAETIANLPPGGRIEVAGTGFYTGSRKRFSAGRPDEVGTHQVFLEISRLADDKLSIKLSFQRNRPGLMKAIESASDTISASASDESGATINANLHLGFEWYETFEIDLGHKDATKHIETLLALDAQSADQRAQVDGSGIERTSKLRAANNSFDINIVPLSLTEAVSEDMTFGLVLRTSHEWLNAEDSAIRKDPIRNAVTKSAAEEGNPITWYQTTGIIEPRLSLLTGFSETGTVSAEAGLQLGSVLRYSILSAQPQDMTGATLKAFNEAIEMAATDLNALSSPEIPPGTEITYQGIGTIRALLRTTAGYNREIGAGFELAASLGSELSKEEMGEVALNVKKLEDGRLTITIVRANQETDNAALRFKAGVDMDAIEALEHYNGDSVITGWLDGKFDEKLHDLMEDSVSDLANIKAIARRAETSGNREILKIGPLDPGAVENKELLKSLLLPQQSSAAFSESAAFLALNESHKVEKNKVELEFMSKRLFLHEVLKQEKDGHLRSDIGEMVYTEKEIKRNFSFISELNSEWEAVTYKTDLLKDGEATFFHLKLNFDDPFTTREEVADFQELVNSFDAKLLGDSKIEKTHFFGRLFSRHGQTTKNIDVWFSDDGIQQLIDTSPEKARRIFIENAAVEDPSLLNPPWMAQPGAEHWQNLFDRYNRTHRVRGPKGGDNHRRLRTMEREYRRQYNRNLRKDALLYSQMNLFDSAISKIGAQSLSTEDMPKLLDELVNLGELTLLGENQRRGKKEFFLRSIATLADLMSPEHIYINQMSLVGKNVNIRTESEGRLIHPNEVIRENLDRDR